MQQVLDNLDVQYTYHVHEGSAGTTANGCYTLPVYHAHSNSCYKTCGGKQTIVSSNSSYMKVKCTSCGDTSNEDPDYDVFICGVTTLICNKAGTISSYKLGCGKTIETIESATIIY